MPSINALSFRLRTLARLWMLGGIRALRTWNSHTVNESYHGNASPLEAASFLALQNLPRLKKRKKIDRKLRQYIKLGWIRRGVLANGYPEPMPEQAGLFDEDDRADPNPEVEPANTHDLVSLIDEVNAGEQEYLSQTQELDLDEEYEDEGYEPGWGFAHGLVIGVAVTALVPLWMWLQPRLQSMPMMQAERYSPHVIKVAASRGQDCTRAKDLYSQLYCGELWRKELDARVKQTYTDLLAVSTAIDHMQRETGFEVARPLAERVKQTHNDWQAHLESSCNTASAIEHLGGVRSNQYLDCVHQHLLDREAEMRKQLNYLRGLGWQKEAADVLNNELIAIRNMSASEPESAGTSDSAPKQNTGAPPKVTPDGEELVPERGIEPPTY